MQRKLEPLRKKKKKEIYAIHRIIMVDSIDNT